MATCAAKVSSEMPISMLTIGPMHDILLESIICGICVLLELKWIITDQVIIKVVIQGQICTMKQQHHSVHICSMSV